jgi:hypothetical protein
MARRRSLQATAVTLVFDPVIRGCFRGHRNAPKTLIKLIFPSEAKLRERHCRKRFQPRSSTWLI